MFIGTLCRLLVGDWGVVPLLMLFGLGNISYQSPPNPITKSS